MTVVDAELHESLVEIFTQTVMIEAALPAARREDGQESPTFSSTGGEILCTCNITGATHSDSREGTMASAEAFARTVGKETASLVARTKKNHHYAWLYSGR